MKLFSTLVRAVRTAIALVAVLSLSWLLCVPAANAQSFFSGGPRSFLVEQPCNAVSSIRKGSFPLPVNPGTTYRAIGENKMPGGTHAFIEIGGQQKWLSLSCGRYEGAAPSPVTPPVGNPNANFAPFFDTLDNPVRLRDGSFADATPAPPQLDDFDRAVNELCGAPGKVVSRAEFEGLMDRFPEVLDDLRAFTGDRVFGDRPPIRDRDTYRDRLTDAWFDVHGFDHIFCGEPTGSGIGGLHFAGRYLDLQQRGLGGALAAVEIEPGAIYTLGVVMQVGDRAVRSNIKGYGYTLSAADILKFSTRAFADNPTRSSSSTGCILPIADDGESFDNVFVYRAAGIRTFYPDATPDFGRNGPCNLTAAIVEPTPAPQPLTDVVQIGAGSTLPGATHWQSHTDGVGIFVDIDTLAAGFSGTPFYFVTLSGRYDAESAIELADVTDEQPGGFRVYARSADGSVLTPAIANDRDWAVRWLGVVTADEE